MFGIIILQEHIDGDFARIDEKLQYKLGYDSNLGHVWTGAALLKKKSLSFASLKKKLHLPEEAKALQYACQACSRRCNFAMTYYRSCQSCHKKPKIKEIQP